MNANTTKAGSDRKTNGTPRPEKPEGIRVPLAQRVRPFNLAATETCRWFDGPFYLSEKSSGWIGDACKKLVVCIDGTDTGDNLTARQEKHVRLIVAAPLLLAAIEQYRLHCDAPLALTMAVDKLLETIE